MGKKPFVGVVGAVCIGLSLSGCESCGCNQKSSVYQGQTGNARNLVNGSSSSSSTQGAQVAAPSATQPTTAAAWQGQSQTAPSLPSYGASSVQPLPTGPANAGAVVPTTGINSSRNTVTPAVAPSTPVSSNVWPMKPPTDSAIQQTSGTSPMAVDTAQVPLGSPVSKTSSFGTTQRTTDGYNGMTADQASAKAINLPAPPPLPRSMSTDSGASVSHLSATDAGSSPLLSPPPAATAPAAVSAPVPPPVVSGSDNFPLPPPVPGSTLK